MQDIRSAHVDVTDAVTIIATGEKDRIAGFFKIVLDRTRNGDLVDFCKDCHPEDPELGVIGVGPGHCERFYRPWELAWHTPASIDAQNLREERERQRRAVESVYGSLPAEFYRDIFKRFPRLTNHELIATRTWQAQIRKQISLLS